MNTENSTLTEAAATVAQLAVSHPAALAIFEKYNIDYCCGGHRSLEEACQRIGLDANKVRQEIFGAGDIEGSFSIRTEAWSSALLIEYIIQNHHSYVAAAILEINPLLDKVCAAHGDESSELLAIREDFRALAEELTEHMKKEEFILFPAIKRLEAQSHTEHPLIDAIQSPIAAMEHDHDVAGDLIKRIRTLSNNYTAPPFACPTYRITYKKLQEFDNDLMRHIHLENNILFERMKGRTA